MENKSENSIGKLYEKHKKIFCAEFLGTFALVLVGAGAVIAEAHTGLSHQGIPTGKVTLVGIAFAHGLTLMAMIVALGSISGAHFNPAVSLGFLIQGKLKKELFPGYVVAQFGGAILAGFLLAGFFPDEIGLSGLGTPSLAPKITLAKGMLFEGMITFMLMITILFATREDNPDRSHAAFAIGMTLAALILFVGPLTGAAANPARYLGPALASANLSQLLPYFVGQFAGGALASVAYSLIMGLGIPLVAEEEERDDEVRKTNTAKGSRTISLKTNNGVTQSLVKNAYQLFQGGKQQEAVTELSDLVKSYESRDRADQHKILTLWLYMEEEIGKIDQLNDYRHLIYSVVSGRTNGQSPIN